MACLTHLDIPASALLATAGADGHDRRQRRQHERDAQRERRRASSVSPAVRRSLRRGSRGIRQAGRACQGDRAGSVGVPQRCTSPAIADADADGYVQYPNVDLAIEQVNMMEASRAYEANITMMETLEGDD